MRPVYLLAALAAILAGPAAPAAAQGKKYALLVGVTRYKHAALPNLQFPVNDVEELGKLLRAPAAGFASVRVLTEDRAKQSAKDAPTAANIRQALKELLASRGKDDLILIALSGHGAQLLVSDPDGKGDPKALPFFCPSDADLLGISYRTGEAKTLINLNTLFADLGKCGAGTKLVLIDACRNTLKVEGARRNMDAKNVEVPEGVSVLYSCGPGEVAWEVPNLGRGHGVFFYHVLEGLRGKAKNGTGPVTWDALKTYVRDAVPATVKRVLGARATKQVPHSVENLSGESPVLTQSNRPDDAEATYRRAMGLMTGTGGRLDRPEAVRLSRQAADKGHVKAQVMLGWMTSGSENGRQRVANGAAALRQAAEGGDADAQVWLGTLLEGGVGVGKDERAAVGWYRKAAEQNHAHGQYQLGAAYRTNRGVARDGKAAASWLRKAADQGHALAQAALGIMAEEGEGGEKNLAEAARHYRQAAERGHPGAQYNLAELLLERKTAAQDKEAARWARQAADAGVTKAQHRLGGLYADGRGVAPDDKQAVRWFRKAADRGYAPAQNDLGYMYEKGRGVTEDRAVALSWYKKAAEGGHAPAMYKVGLAYELGVVVKEDRAEALRWYRKAAAKRYEPAKRAIGRLAGKNDT